MSHISRRARRGVLLAGSDKCRPGVMSPQLGQAGSHPQCVPKSIHRGQCPRVRNMIRVVTGLLIRAVPFVAGPVNLLAIARAVVIAVALTAALVGDLRLEEGPGRTSRIIANNVSERVHYGGRPPLQLSASHIWAKIEGECARHATAAAQRRSSR